MKRLALACLSAIALGACGGGGGDTEGGQEASTEYEGPIASSDVARGQEVYDQVCSGCHSNGPSLENIGWSAARVRRQIREGSGRMPPIRATRVSDDDLEAILAWMQTIGGVTGDGAAPASTGGQDTDGDVDEDDLDDEADESGADTDA
ncbi:MAG: cytochrome c [Sandaracinaceae bacterium]|nr:cytochrome c [Sandaracinaceae bacterium]